MSVFNFFLQGGNYFWAQLLTPTSERHTKKHWIKNTPRRSHAGVYLLGAGPGDPELLTRKAERLLRDANVVLYDNLVSDEVLALCSLGCRRIYVGKRAGKHAMCQSEINQLLVQYGRLSQSHQQVIVRVKGGDPAIFGRVHEEATALQAAGIPFAIVPGITSASAACAYGGIALTSRGQAASVQFLTAQFADPNRQPDWQHYRYQVGQNPTLVVYMGLNRLSELTQGLMRVGWPSAMPIALLDQLSSEQQQQLKGSLSDITALYAAHQQGPTPFQGPTLMVIGSVVQQTMAVDLRLLAALSN